MKDDFDKYISRRKSADKIFGENFESGYQEFKAMRCFTNNCGENLQYEET